MPEQTPQTVRTSHTTEDGRVVEGTMTADEYAAHIMAAPGHSTREIAELPSHLRHRYVVREYDGRIVDATQGGRELSFDEADVLAARYGFSVFDI